MYYKLVSLFGPSCEADERKTLMRPLQVPLTSPTFARNPKFISHIDILTNTFLTWMKNQNRQTAANNAHLTSSTTLGFDVA